MQMIILFIVALVPCIIFAGMIVAASRKCIPALSYWESMLCFVFGVLTVLPLWAWPLMFGLWEKSFTASPLAYDLFGAFFMAALPEELCRYLILRWRLSRFPAPVNLMQCLVFGSLVGLGFGTIEHVKYTLQEGWQALGERLFTAVLIHTMTGAIIGFFVGLSINKRQAIWGLCGVSLTIALHGLHNFLVGGFFVLSDQLYWSLRIVIELIYAVVLFILIRKAILVNRSDAVQQLTQTDRQAHR